MSAIKNHLHDYSQALDAAWEALEEAIIKSKELNDLIYNPDGELTARAPRADVYLLVAKLKELQDELGAFEAAKEPSQPILAMIAA